MDAAAKAIHTAVNNRVDNKPLRAPVANQCRRGRFAGEAVLPLSLLTVLTVAAHRPCRRCGRLRIGSAGEPGRERLVSSVIRFGKSGPQACRSPSPPQLPPVFGLAGYRHDSSRVYGSHEATAGSAAPRRRARFTTLRTWSRGPVRLAGPMPPPPQPPHTVS
jgi:hypothetical protein